jgi:3-oxoacyl-[acyl-carrier protein] reductase
MFETLKDKTVVLAGGSGGLGRASAELLAAEGARVVVSYRANRKRAASLENIAAIIDADLAQADDRARLLDEAPSLYGLVVFAGDPSRAAGPSNWPAKQPSE